jgi:capsular polysaccharide biosynthesis protein
MHLYLVRYKLTFKIIFLVTGLYIKVNSVSMMDLKLIKIIEYFKFNLPNLFFFLLKIKRIYKKRIVWLDNVSENNLQKLMSNDNCFSCSPLVRGDINKLYFKQDIDINLYIFRNVVLNSHSSNFLLMNENVVLVERVVSAPVKYSNYSTGVIKLHNSEYALIKLKRKTFDLNNILFMGGNGSFNYYHWLIEIVPKFLYLNNKTLIENEVDFIVCDSKVEEIASFSRILNILLEVNGIDIPVLYVKNKKNIKAKTVLYINNFNNIVFNSKEKLSSVKYSHFHVESLKKMREVFIGFCKNKDRKYSKIFLARKNDQVRSYNQDEILNYFIKQGFLPVYLEDYTFEEQINIFYHADFIVGPSGAAWANLIFCKEGSRAISWLPEQLSEFSVFSSLAHIFKCDLKFILTSMASDREKIHSDYIVDVSEVINLYENFEFF